jgi:hypothetical protein
VAHASFAGSADDDVKQAQQLLKTGKGAQAYEVLKGHVDAKAGNPEFDLLLGMAAVDAGKPNRAVFALERVLDAQPDNDLARAELARAYYELGENDTAKAEFDAVRGKQLPSSIAATIDQYLSGIEQRLSATRTRYDVFIETGLGYDSNVNSATSNNQVALPALGGLVFTLTPGSTALDSKLWLINAGFNFYTPLRQDTTLFGGIEFDNRLAVDESDFSQHQYNGTLGVNLRRGVDQYRLIGQAQKYTVGGSDFRDYGGFVAQWQRDLDANNQITVFAQGAVVQYPGQSIRNVDRVAGGVGWGHAFSGAGKPIIYATVYGGGEFDTHDNADFVGRDFAGLRLGGQYMLNDRWYALGSFEYEHSNYDGKEPFFLKARDEDYVTIDAGLRYALNKNVSIRPELRYSRNDSNINVFAYDDWQGLTTLRYDF